MSDTTTDPAAQRAFLQIVSDIQKSLKAPKSQRNNFGKYNYRNCEDIMEAVKPLLGDFLVLNVSDDIVQVGDRFYVKATAKLVGPDGVSLESTAFAREPLNKKGMDESQITGAASSYARKYALNGLFCIDDTKDPDSDAPPKNETKTPAPATQTTQPTTSVTAPIHSVGDKRKLIIGKMTTLVSTFSEAERSIKTKEVLDQMGVKEGKEINTIEDPVRLDEIIKALTHFKG